MRKLLLLSMIAFCSGVYAANYYPTSIAAANVLSVKAGDSIIFKAGVYTGALTVRSGVIYQFRGATLSNPNSKTQASIYLYNVSNATIDGVIINDGNDYGIFVDGGSGNTIKNANISNAGIGVQFNGSRCVLQSSYIHKLRMIVNTVGGYDDYGANGIVVGSPNCSVVNNIFDSCRAKSYDFGYDGGAVEVFGTNVDSLIVQGNVAMNSEGFIEFGASGGGHSNGVSIQSNILTNNGRVVWCNSTGQFAITVTGIIKGNVVTETIPNSYRKLFDGNPYPSALVLGANIYYVTTKIAIQ